MRTLAIILLICTTTYGANTKERTEYNKSMASLMGGIAQITTANANVLKAVGDYKTKMMDLHKQAEEIKSARMDNELKRTETFYAKRQQYADYRKTRTIKRKVPTSNIQTVSYSSNNYVSWSKTFDNSIYIIKKNNIDKLFSQRTINNSGLGSTNCNQIRLTIEQLRALLKNNISNMKPIEYIAAKNFLNTLEKDAEKTYNVIDKIVAY